MNCKFEELKCACCGSKLEQGTINVGDDVQQVKRCSECDFWMIIVIPNDKYNYSIKKELKNKYDDDFN